MSAMSGRVVGTGSIGRRYLDVLESMDFDHIQPLSVRHDWKESTSSWPAAPSADLTVIATRTSRHLADAAYFAPSSATLLIEKPVCARVNDFDGVDGSPNLQSAFVSAPLRFTEALAFVRTQLSECGEVTGVSSVCKSWLPDWRPSTNFRESYSASSVDGGVLLDLVHEIDYCRLIFGDALGIRGALYWSRALNIESESKALMIWRYPDFPLSMELDYTSRVSRRGLRVDGTVKSIEWNLLTASVEVWDHGSHSVETVVFPEDLDRNLLLARQVNAVMNPDVDNRGAGLADGMAAVQVCDAARASAAQSGAEVPIEGWSPCL
jgi:predicted dehydrogenase